MAMRRLLRVVIASLLLDGREATQAPSSLVLETDGNFLLSVGSDADEEAKTQGKLQPIHSTDVVGKIPMPKTVVPNVDGNGLASMTEVNGKEGTSFALNKTEPVRSDKAQEDSAKNSDKREVPSKEGSSS